MNTKRLPHIENPHRNHKFWHKVQIHCHSNESDAKSNQTPAAVEEAYRDAGYDCVFLTDHEKVTPDPGVPGVLHIDASEHGKGRHHTLALGIDRTAGDRYHPDPEVEGYVLAEDEAGSQVTPSCACRNILGRLKHVTEVERAIPVVAHPNARHFCSGLLHPHFCGGGWSRREILGYAHQCSGLEIFNANNAARRMWGLNRWDDVLATGTRAIWGFASDDCHDVHDQRTFDRGFILVNSEIDPADCRRGKVDRDTWRQEILRNIRGGNFCAVVRLEKRRRNGRLISPAPDGVPPLSVSCSGAQIRVATGLPCERVEFHTGSSSPHQPATASASASLAYDVGDWEDYVRICVLHRTDDGQHYILFSQPLLIRRDQA